jgi:hypothetical protein
MAASICDISDSGVDGKLRITSKGLHPRSPPPPTWLPDMVWWIGLPRERERERERERLDLGWTGVSGWPSEKEWKPTTLPVHTTHRQCEVGPGGAAEAIINRIDLNRSHFIAVQGQVEIKINK